MSCGCKCTTQGMTFTYHSVPSSSFAKESRIFRNQKSSPGDEIEPSTITLSLFDLYIKYEFHENMERIQEISSVINSLLKWHSTYLQSEQKIRIYEYTRLELFELSLCYCENPGFSSTDSFSSNKMLICYTEILLSILTN